MAGDNGNGKTKLNEAKLCPFLNDTCIEAKCALYCELMQSTAGLIQKSGACSIGAMVLILSEMNQKAAVSQQQQSFQLPRGILR